MENTLFSRLSLSLSLIFLAILLFAAAGLVQRCVVVQKDSLGFGFTVCGERIKLVQNVRPGITESRCKLQLRFGRV